MKIVVLTGAGISAESGIPTFRGADGLWEGHRVEEVATPTAFQQNPELVHKFYNARRRHLLQEHVRPNAAHIALAEFEASHDDDFLLITQNVDNLHQESGVGDGQITELHGNATYAKCLDCQLRYDLAELKESFLRIKEPPQCNECNGLIKTATISFGQPMPEEEMVIAQKKSISCDLFICIGTSLAVFPAADLPVLAKETGSKLAIINNEPTQMDHIADLVINRDISEVFSEISL